MLQRFDVDQNGELNSAELKKAIDAQAFDAPAKPRTLVPSTKADAKGEKEKRKYIRVNRNKRGRPISMDTSVTKFASKDKALQVDLIGAVHVGDKSYYDKLNKLFKDYDAVLYELVAPEGTRVPRGGSKTRHPIGGIQKGMTSVLELDYQLDQVNYHARNFVHADMTPEEFSKSMSDKNESFLQMMFRAMGQASAMQAKNAKKGKKAPSEFDLFSAFFAKDRALKLKRVMSEQFEDIEGQMSLFDSGNGSTLITERNKKALSILKREIAKKKKRLAIFYGAGHLPDMAERLEKDFGLKYQGESWLQAWDMK